MEIEEFINKYGLEKINSLSSRTKLLLKILLIFIIIVAFVVSIPLGFAIISGYLGIKATIKHISFMKSFAAENGLKYAPFFAAGDLKGRLFSVSNSELAGNSFSGKHNNTPFRIFNYIYSVGDGKNRRSYKFTVSEIEIEKTIFPYILLQSKSMAKYSKGSLLKNKDIEISLEENFKKTYKLFAKENYEIEVLEIFTKDLLNFLKENGSHFSIEFADNKIYIYDDRLIHKKKNLSALLDLTKKIIEKTAPLLGRLSDDFSALHAYYNA